jgi:hypothetical protein
VQFAEAHPGASTLVWDTNMGGGVVPAAAGDLLLSDDPAVKRKRMLDTTVGDELQRE